MQSLEEKEGGNNTRTAKTPWGYFFMLFRRFYRFITALVSLALVCLFALGFYAANVSKLGEIAGERTFYLDSPSSQGVRKGSLSLLDIFRVEGESVRFARTEETEEEIVARIRDTYGAKLLFSESACGVTSYYCYVKSWQNGIDIEGVTVNLHIAVSKTACAVGTPIIFDGF